MPPNVKAAPLATGPLDQDPGKGSVMPTIRETAVTLAERGFAVFPCGTPGGGSHGHAAGPDKDCPRCKAEKAPRSGWKWQARNSADPAVVGAHWPQDGPNIGVACHASRLVVVDLDTPAHGGVMPAEWTARGGIREGADVFAYLVEQAGADWPDTLTVRTASGGTHLYFRAIPGRPIPNSAGRVGPMVDVRGDGNADGTPGGGYVVGPGSTVGGVRYRLDRGAARVMPLPGWLADLADPPRPARSTRTYAQLDGATTRRPGQAYAEAALRGELDEVLTAPGGQRNTRLHRAAFSLGQLVTDGALSRDRVLTLLHQAGESIGLGDREVRATVASGFRSGAQHPRKTT